MKDTITLPSETVQALVTAHDVMKRNPVPDCLIEPFRAALQQAEPQAHRRLRAGDWRKHEDGTWWQCTDPDIGRWVSNNWSPETTPPEPQAQAGEPTGCACRWDKDDNRVQTCERHQGWLDVVHEWAERAKLAEAELQSHREAMAAKDALLFQTQNAAVDLAQQLAKKDAALKACVEALEKLFKRDQQNTCQHESTHRGGAIWEICDDCGSQWADDRGGKPKWKDPIEWTTADAAITQARGALK